VLIAYIVQQLNGAKLTSLLQKGVAKLCKSKLKSMLADSLKQFETKIFRPYTVTTMHIKYILLIKKKHLVQI
jgi:hypothetical protein